MALSVPTRAAWSGQGDDSVSLLGLPGTLRTLSAFPLRPGRWSHNAVGGMFIARDLALKGMDHSELDASYALSYRPWLTPRLTDFSFSMQTGVRGDLVTNDDEYVGTLEIGDVTLGAHYRFWQNDRAALAAALPVLIQPRLGNGPAGLAAGPAFLLLGSIQPAALNGMVSNEVDLNIGFRLDSTTNYLKAREEDVLRYNRVARGQFAESSYVVQAGYRAVVGRYQPYLEWAWWLDADGKAANSKGEKVKLPFRSNPLLITPGVKTPLSQDVQLELAVDLGALTGRFPGENEVVPPWKLWVGLAWARGGPEEQPVRVAPAPAPVPESPPQTTFQGKLLDPAGLPIVAVITVDNRWKVQSSPTDGSFSITIDVGRHVVVIEGEGFETITQDIDLDLNRPIVLDVTLKPTGKVRVTGEKIVIYVKIFFATGEAEILPESFAVLDEVAAVMERAPQLRVRVEGHTDSTGSAEKNLDLSQSRAEAVVEYLVSKAISRDRLEARGYGDTVPLADNSTDEGRSRNRRVEFTILDSGSEPADH